MMDIYQLVGFAGAGLIILAYFLLTEKRLQENYVLYHLLNFLGSAGIAVSAFMTKSWPSMLIFVLLFASSIYFMFKILKIKPSYKELGR
jgi:hypothetical protein